MGGTGTTSPSPAVSGTTLEGLLTHRGLRVSDSCSMCKDGGNGLSSPPAQRVERLICPGGGEQVLHGAWRRTSQELTPELRHPN